MPAVSRRADQGDRVREIMASNPFDPGYYDETELAQFGFGSVGTNVRIAKNCTLINLNSIFIGSNVRIDGLTTIVAGPEPVKIGNFIHISGGCFIIGGSGVEFEDFSGLSHGVRIFSRGDDFTHGHLTNPTIPKKYSNVKSAPVALRKHVIVGSGSVILPGVTLAEGAAVGALSLVRKSTEPWTVYSGNPAVKIMSRKEISREAEQELLNTLKR
jgi:acetyltransferase-like isoleucine patch superfamily enzyme